MTPSESREAALDALRRIAKIGRSGSEDALLSERTLRALLEDICIFAERRVAEAGA